MDYYAVCQFIADVFGKDRIATDVGPEDFATLRRKFMKVHGPVRLGKDVTITRMAFKFGYESGLLETPVRFVPNFKSTLDDGHVDDAVADREPRSCACAVSVRHRRWNMVFLIYECVSLFHRTRMHRGGQNDF